MRFLLWALLGMMGSLFAGSSEDKVEISILMSPNIVKDSCVELDTCLSPKLLIVPAGTIVTWYNATGRAINITPGIPGNPSNLFPPQQLDVDENFSFLFEKPGHYPFYDAAHPWATGEIYVIAQDAASS